MSALRVVPASLVVSRELRSPELELHRAVTPWAEVPPALVRQAAEQRSAVQILDQLADPGIRHEVGAKTVTLAGSKVVTHNAELEKLMKGAYTSADVKAVERFLEQHRVTELKPYASTQLYPAAVVGHGGPSDLSRLYGYQKFWTRDMAIILHGLVRAGKTEQAAEGVHALLKFYQSEPEAAKLRNVLNGHVALTQLTDQNRPSIAGEASTGKETPWMMHQNDALGFLLMTAFDSANRGVVKLSDAQLPSLAMVAAYLERVGYAHDKDVGAWEEGGDRSGFTHASSIGMVVQGLKAMQRWMAEGDNAARLQSAYEGQVTTQASRERFRFTPEATKQASVEALVRSGVDKLDTLLPFESRDGSVYTRKHDVALLNLVYFDLQRPPAERILKPSMVKAILDNAAVLEGSHGYKRYNLDGYWNYMNGARPWDNHRVVDASMSTTLEARVQMRAPVGGEAQWTLVDPLLSAIHGQLAVDARAQGDGDGFSRHLIAQTRHFNRALGAVTADGKTPESYYLTAVKDQHPDTDVEVAFKPNPHNLNWTKANLLAATDAMKKTLAS